MEQSVSTELCFLCADTEVQAAFTHADADDRWG